MTVIPLISGKSLIERGEMTLLQQSGMQNRLMPTASWLQIPLMPPPPIQPPSSFGSTTDCWPSSEREVVDKTLSFFHKRPASPLGVYSLSSGTPTWKG